MASVPARFQLIVSAGAKDLPLSLHGNQNPLKYDVAYHAMDDFPRDLTDIKSVFNSETMHVENLIFVSESLGDIAVIQEKYNALDTEGHYVASVKIRSGLRLALCCRTPTPLCAVSCRYARWPSSIHSAEVMPIGPSSASPTVRAWLLGSPLLDVHVRLLLRKVLGRSRLKSKGCTKLLDVPRVSLRFACL